MAEDKINVLHLRDSPWVDGPGRTILESASAIDASRFNYLIAGFTNPVSTGNQFIAEAQKRGLKIFNINETGPFDYKIISQILSLIDKHNIHILHSHEFRSDLMGLICARIKRIPVVTTLHGWIGNGMKGRIFVTIDKMLLRFFDHVITVSKLMGKQVQKLGVSNNRLSVLYNSLIIDRYMPDINDNSFREELGVEADTLLVANIGRLSPEKGQADFILAARSVLETHQNAKFLLIGIGPEQEMLENLASDIGIRDAVIFTGYRNDMMGIYNSLDLVVQSSYTEGMPNVILEALLMEVPVIATNVGGTAEVIKDNTTGVLLKPNSSDEIADKIKEYVAEREIFKEMAKAGREIVKRNFNFIDRTDKLTAIYEKMMKNRGDK